MWWQEAARQKRRQMVKEVHKRSAERKMVWDDFKGWVDAPTPKSPKKGKGKGK